MFKRLRNWFSPPKQRIIVARYDAAQTTRENQRHWANADSLSANAAMEPSVRCALRNRARYEVANNSYARGLVSTLANYVVGTGPRLQCATDNTDANQLIEAEWGAWAKAVGLADKLRIMREAQCESGEVFALLVDNPRVDNWVTLDLRLIEADQVASPWLNSLTSDATTDGIRFDEFGNPTQYCILKEHPGDQHATVTAGEATLIAARDMIHLYRANRPGQCRGIPEITPALPLFALLRRYTLAVLGSAEQAALPSGVIYTDGPGEGAESPTPLDTVELNRGEWMTLPDGWKIGQVKAEQPTGTYAEFKHEILNEIARCLNIPYNIAAGNSNDASYASGRLDHQAFVKAVRIDRTRLADVVLDRLFRLWFAEWSVLRRIDEGVAEIESGGAETVPHSWFWDGFEHVDPAKEANAQSVRLTSGTTNWAHECAENGDDWEAVIRQRARELELARELGVPTEQARLSPDSPEGRARGEDG